MVHAPNDGRENPGQTGPEMGSDSDQYSTNSAGYSGPGEDLYETGAIVGDGRYDH